jgi:hypothetical protein
MGRGVFAGKSYSKGDIVEVSQLVTWDSETDRLIQDSELRFYVFEGVSGRSGPSALALGNGSLYNHSETENVTYKIVPKKNTIVFRARTKILKGEQLFINYGYDPIFQKNHFDSMRANKDAEIRVTPEELKLDYKESRVEKLKKYINENFFNIFILTITITLISAVYYSADSIRKRNEQYVKDCNSLKVHYGDWVELKNSEFYKNATFVVIQRYSVGVDIKVLGGDQRVIFSLCGDLKKVSK